MSERASEKKAKKWEHDNTKMNDTRCKALKNQNHQLNEWKTTTARCLCDDGRDDKEKNTKTHIVIIHRSIYHIKNYLNLSREKINSFITVNENMSIFFSLDDFPPCHSFFSLRLEWQRRNRWEECLRFLCCVINNWWHWLI